MGKKYGYEILELYALSNVQNMNEGIDEEITRKQTESSN